MAIATADELRSLSGEELVDKLREAKEELFNLRFQAATGQLSNNRRLQAVRRDIARIYTVMRERELGITDDPAVAAGAADDDATQSERA
ncbi:50S ribosomal protein L29 [Frankia sp. CcI156]|jgi:large subunit ribosomal protein L29|uniref:Large ribosomal subunit protein uL29 n=3 Tax=Frankia TaxID=1854 RepID=Q2JFG8_FRACC|nr:MULTISPECIES: 50S ribosomal protein L29 [Frankia]AYF60744.1 50S ribosomal protein L29 [uncultured Frankia sp.]ABD09974.1 LSU ribosomal protein L29P [Frankia casuarinae]ETA04316.1 LSU ribosomal protein L29P [Frankia sp. CcI6]EYT92235.1 LSU ribosomal protein L29P [Frankia casuarinae]KDA45010.1 LSU ribosomal protein L29P [Frankia sp. BMG5.23]